METTPQADKKQHKHRHSHKHKRGSRGGAAPSPSSAAATPSSKTPSAAGATAAPNGLPLHSAKDAEAVRALLESGARVDAVDAEGRTALHTAVAAKLPDVAKALLAAAGGGSGGGGGSGSDAAFINRRTASGDTALHIAARAGNLQLCSLLISAHADPNTKNGAGQTALHLAAGLGSAALVSLLVENGANVRAHDDFDRTPLHLAAGAASAETDVVSYLLKHGAQIDAADKDGHQPLDYALKLGHEAKAHILQASGADVGLRYRPKERQAANAATAATSASACAAPEEPVIVRVDRWGFEEAEPEGAPASAKETAKAAAKRARKERERAAKWAVMMYPQAHWERVTKREVTKLRRRVLKGIPESARGAAWQLMARAAQRKATFPAGYYAQLLVPNTSSGEQIDLDINRCFRTHVLFKERYGDGQCALWNILKAYSNYDKEVSYCQGMTEIAGILLMYMPEEDAFWTLVQLLNEPSYAMRNMFLTGFPALHTAFHCHTQLVKKYLPRLHEHFEHENISSIYYATKWFMTLFLDVLPWELCLRVWDVLFFEGIHIIHTIALRILELQQKELLSLPFEQLMFRLTSLKYIKTNPDEFIAFVTKNKLSEALLDTYRLEHTLAVFEANAARGAASSAKGKARQSEKDKPVTV